jgi:hypothetical protein
VIASLTNNHFKGKILNGGITNLSTADVRAALVKTTTTVDTEDDIEFLSGYTTLAEATASGYARVTCTGEAVAIDTTNNRAEFTTSNMAFAAMAAGDTIQGVLLYVHVGADSANLPIAFLEFSSNFLTNGGALTITPSAEGLLQLA